MISFPITYIKSLLPLLVIICSFQFSSVAQAATAPFDRMNTRDKIHSEHFVNPVSINGPDCIAPENEKEQPSPDSNSSPDSTSDIDDSDSARADLKADISSRNDQDPPHYADTGLDAVTLRTPSFLRLRQPERSPYNYLQHEHIRERAPPILG